LVSSQIGSQSNLDGAKLDEKSVRLRGASSLIGSTMGKAEQFVTEHEDVISQIAQYLVQPVNHSKDEVKSKKIYDGDISAALECEFYKAL
jgi:hypothetical protein